MKRRCPWRLRTTLVMSSDRDAYFVDLLHCVFLLYFVCDIDSSYIVMYIFFFHRVCIFLIIYLCCFCLLLSFFRSFLLLACFWFAFSQHAECHITVHAHDPRPLFSFLLQECQDVLYCFFFLSLLCLLFCLLFCFFACLLMKVHFRSGSECV